MSGNCSHCGNNGHNSRTCGGDAACETGFMLFGVRLTTSQGASFRKSVSMNNLSQYEHSHDRHADAASCYDSDDVVHASGRSRERKRGVPWTEDEHRLFLLGLQKVGKGDWRGISRNFVKTRTPTQVASHAQKYFLRRNNLNRRRRRSSLFDITDTCLGSEVEEQAAFNQESVNSLPPPPPPPAAQPDLSSSGIGVGGFPECLGTVCLPANGDSNYSPENIISSPPQTPKLIRPIPIVLVPSSSKMADLNLNPKSFTSETALLPLSLKLSTPSSDEQSSPTSASTTPTSSSASALQGMRGHGDGIISVA